MAGSTWDLEPPGSAISSAKLKHIRLGALGYDLSECAL